MRQLHPPQSQSRFPACECWRKIALTLIDPVPGGFERKGLISSTIVEGRKSVAPFAVGGHSIVLEKYLLGAQARSFLSEIFTSSGRKSFFEMVVQLNPLRAAHEPERPGTPSRAGRVGSRTKIISKNATDSAKNC